MIENFKPEGFVAAHFLCPSVEATDLLFYFADNKILLVDGKRLPQGQDWQSLALPDNTELYCFGHFKEQRCLLVSPPPAPNMQNLGLEARALKLSHELLGEELFRLAGLAAELYHWRSTHLYCGHCGSPSEDKDDERAKICPRCHYTSYPKLHPCIIVVVMRGPELLLARSPAFPVAVYSALAGFIEPGETVEDAVAREVKEEVGIQIKNLRYLRSQPWPFPNSLMLGFLADYESGTIEIDKKEIEDAQWFKADSLPTLGSHLSISRFLIEEALQICQKSEA